MTGDTGGTPTGDGSAGDDPGGPTDRDSGATAVRDAAAPETAPGSTDPSPPADDPLGDLAADVRRRRESTGGSGGGRDAAASLFESVEVDPVDVEDVWDDLLDDAADGDGDEDGRAGAGVDGADGRVADGDAPDERVVEKRSFCQRCPHFGSPPAATCGHGSAEIVAVVDFDRFRVRGCPMVAEYGGEDGPGSIPRSDNP